MPLLIGFNSPIAQSCPVCRGFNHVERKDVVTCHAGRPHKIGKVCQCLDCGSTFYALRDGRTALVGGAAAKEAAEQVSASGALPGKSERAVRSRPTGLEDMRTASTLPRESVL